MEPSVDTILNIARSSSFVVSLNSCAKFDLIRLWLPRGYCTKRRPSNGTARLSIRVALAWLLVGLSVIGYSRGMLWLGLTLCHDPKKDPDQHTLASEWLSVDIW